MYPEPITVNRFGTFFNSSSVVLVRYSTSSSPEIGGKEGEAPVAIKKRFADSFFPFTSTVFSSTNFASPCGTAAFCDLSAQSL